MSATSTRNYHKLSQFYEHCLQQHGATPKGVDWPNEADLHKRFKIMLELFSHEAAKKIELLDLGCGYGALVPFVNPAINYTGIDISEKMIATACRLFPKHHFAVRDILEKPLEKNSVDYIIMNGLLTEKRELKWQEMVQFAQQIILNAFQTCRKGIAFNVMNAYVDWCNPNLFYWSYDDISAFLFANCSRHIVIRNDYGLYESTIYVYKSPRM